MAKTNATQEHFARYDAIARWLGWEQVAALVPFTVGVVQAALAQGDEHLNTLNLSRWDARHREVLALHRAAVGFDRYRGVEPLRTSWSLSETVCTLKHVAREEAFAARKRVLEAKLAAAGLFGGVHP